MKIEVISETNDTNNGESAPTHIRITSESGEVIEITVEDDTTYHHQYTPYLYVNHEKPAPEEKEIIARFRQLVRKHKPDASNEECEEILSEHTDYPFCSLEKSEEQIREYLKNKR